MGSRVRIESAARDFFHCPTVRDLQTLIWGYRLRGLESVTWAEEGGRWSGIA